tara:strand:+ start:972 stop:1337 length:366 start_codon:yes stop_codon:yes gene_type:complete
MENYKLKILKPKIHENIKRKMRYECSRTHLASLLFDEYKTKKLKDNYRMFERFMNNYTLGCLSNKPKEIIYTEQIYMEMLIQYSNHTTDLLKYYNGYIVRKIIEKNNIPRDLFYNILKYIF